MGERRYVRILTRGQSLCPECQGTGDEPEVYTAATSCCRACLGSGIVFVVPR